MESATKPRKKATQSAIEKKKQGRPLSEADFDEMPWSTRYKKLAALEV